MTKAKARQRAKAKAAQKAKKRAASDGNPGNDIRKGQFDPGSSSIRSPNARASVSPFGGARRGASRSR